LELGAVCPGESVTGGRGVPDGATDCPGACARDAVEAGIGRTPEGCTALASAAEENAESEPLLIIRRTLAAKGFEEVNERMGRIMKNVSIQFQLSYLNSQISKYDSQTGRRPNPPSVPHA
jgi:hypothetical protein